MSRFCRAHRAHFYARGGLWLVIVSRSAQAREGNRTASSKCRDPQCMPIRRRTTTQCSRQKRRDRGDDACHPEGVRHIRDNDLINRIHWLFLLAALVLLYQTAQLLKFCGIELLALDEAHEKTVHRTAKEAINHVPNCVARCLLSGQHWCIVIGPAPQSPPYPSFTMKNIEHRLHRGVRQFRRSGEFLLDRLDVGRTAVPQHIHDLQLERRKLLWIFAYRPFYLLTC